MITLQTSSYPDANFVITGGTAMQVVMVTAWNVTDDDKVGIMTTLIF